MHFDNAFLCKNNVVGMQFSTFRNVVGNKGKLKKERAIISVFHDGRSLQVSEDASPQEKEEAMKKYHFLHKHYKPH